MKLEKLVKLQGFNSVCDRLLICPEFDLVVGVHWNFRTMMFSRFSTGKKVHDLRFGRYTVIHEIHRAGHWLFVLRSDEREGRSTISAACNLVNFEFIDFAETHGIDVAYSSFGAATNSNAFFWAPIAESSHSYALDLIKGEFFRNARDIIKFQSFACIGNRFWADYEGGLDDERLSIRRMTPSGLPSNKIIFMDPLAPRPIAVWDDRLLLCYNTAHGVEFRSVTMEGTPLYSLPLNTERYREGMAHQTFCCVFQSASGAERVLVAVSDGYRRLADTGPFRKINYYRLLVFDSTNGSRIWECEIEADSVLDAFVTDRHLIVPWADGFDAIDLDSGKSERIGWPGDKEFEWVRCFPGNNRRLKDRSMDYTTGAAANPPLPYFFWQEEDRTPLFVVKLSE